MTTSRSLRTSMQSERGATLVELAITILVIGVLGFAIVAFLNSGHDDFKDYETIRKPIPSKTTELVYRGHILRCTDFAEMPHVGGASISCRFLNFYKHPRKAPAGSELDKAHVIKITVDGKPMYCVHRRAGDTDYDQRSASCDEVRYENDPMAG